MERRVERGKLLRGRYGAETAGVDCLGTLLCMHRSDAQLTLGKMAALRSEQLATGSTLASAEFNAPTCFALDSRLGMGSSKSCSGSSDGVLLCNVRVQRIDERRSMSLHSGCGLGAAEASAGIAGCACKHRNVEVKLADSEVKR